MSDQFRHARGCLDDRPTRISQIRSKGYCHPRHFSRCTRVLTPRSKLAIMKVHAADIAQGLERLTVAEEVVGSRPIIRPISQFGSELSSL